MKKQLSITLVLENPDTKTDSRGSREGPPTPACKPVQAKLLQGTHKLKLGNNRQFAEKRRADLLKK
jgi:hypothetical protein